MGQITFQRNLFFRNLLLVTFIFVLFGSLFFFQIRPQLVNDTHTSIKHRALDAKYNLELPVQDIFRNVELISDNIVKQGPLKEDKLEFLNFFQMAYPIYDEIALLDLDGKVIASTANNPVIFWNSNPFFDGSLSGKIVISDVQKNARNRFAFWIYSPVFNSEGNVDAIVVVEVPLDNIRKITEKMKVGSSGFIFIADRSGRIIMHPNEQLILKENPYGLGLKDELPEGLVESEEYIAGYSKILGFDNYQLDWIIYAVQSKDEAILGVNSAINSFLLISLFSFIMAVFIGFIISKKTAEPISLLCREIKTSLSGERSFDFSIKTGDEIEEIAASFKKLSETTNEKEILERRKGNLQSRVKELEKLNKLLVGREKKIVALKRKLQKDKRG